MLKSSSQTCQMSLFQNPRVAYWETRKRVLSLEPLSKRIEFSLRKTSGMKESNYDVSNFGSLSAGKIISGRVKRIESFGLFITVDQSKMVGLCHVSELPEDHADNIEAKYKIGERVKAKILKIDEERHRISLGMKQSYFNTNTDDETLQNHDSDSMDEDDSELEDQNPDEFHEPLISFDNGKHRVLVVVNKYFFCHRSQDSISTILFFIKLNKTYFSSIFLKLNISQIVNSYVK